MEEIIKKAIEGGYAVHGKPLRWEEKTKSWWYYWMSEDENGEPYELSNPACLEHPHGMYPMILDPFFWQALGKACGWEGKYKNHWHNQEHNWNQPWIYHSLTFHEINLTKGWDSAISYLSEITK